jgi:hypothetical protein
VGCGAGCMRCTFDVHHGVMSLLRPTCLYVPIVGLTCIEVVCPTSHRKRMVSLTGSRWYVSLEIDAKRNSPATASPVGMSRKWLCVA